jgi:hypothetical protein
MTSQTEALALLPAGAYRHWVNFVVLGFFAVAAVTYMGVVPEPIQDILRNIKVTSLNIEARDAAVRIIRLLDGYDDVMEFYLGKQ